jgi:hypothetical protein
MDRHRHQWVVGGWPWPAKPGAIATLADAIVAIADELVHECG